MIWEESAKKEQAAARVLVEEVAGNQEAGSAAGIGDKIDCPNVERSKAKLNPNSQEVSSREMTGSGGAKAGK